MTMGYGGPPHGGHGMAGFGPAPVAGGNYEFTQYDNETIARVGGRAKTYGVVSTVIGVVLFVLAFTAIAAVPSKRDGALIALGLGAIAVQPVISGHFYSQAGRAFMAVATTQGNDIAHMMEALGKLRSAVRVEAVVAIVALVVGFVGALVWHSMK